MTRAQHHALAWLAYLVLWVAGIFIWLFIVVPAGEDAHILVRVGAPLWWVATTIACGHHFRRFKESNRE